MRIHNVLPALRLLVGAVFVVCSSQNVCAQYIGGDNDVEDWQLYDEEEEDSTEKPKHKEWKNLIYVRYSPSQYTFPSYAPHIDIQEVAAGWARSIQVVDSIPLFVEAGAELKYTFTPKEDEQAQAKYSLLTFRVPVNVTYKLYLSSTRNIALAPYAGIHFRAIAMGKEKVNGKGENIFEDNRENQTSCKWYRCQLGWQVGIRLQLERYFIAASYGRDFPDKKKCPQIHECGLSAGFCF